MDKKGVSLIIAIVLAITAGTYLAIREIFTDVKLYEDMENGDSQSVAEEDIFVNPLPHDDQDVDSGEAVEPEPEIEVLAEPTRATIIGVGDNLIHDTVYTQAARRANWEGYDFYTTYAPVSDIIAGADIASINQETMMSKSNALSSYPMFNSPIELSDTLVDIGFDAITIANNHMFDVYELGLRETIELLKSKPIALSGAYLNYEDYLDIPTIESNGIVFSFVSTTSLNNGLYLPQNSELVAPVTSSDQAVQEFGEQIKRANDISDVVVVNFHWGNEYTHVPTAFQVSTAQYMVDCGADIIFGHHSHVIQPVKYLYNQDGEKAVVVYSLGNFISAQNMAPRVIGGMLEVTVEKFEDVTEIVEVEFLPVITHYDWSFGNITAYPYNGYTKELAANHGVQVNSPEFSYTYIGNTVASVIDEEFLPADFYELYLPYLSQ